MRRVSGNRTLEDVLKCDQCKRSHRKQDSLIVESQFKGRLRLCRECQVKYYVWELNKLNPGIEVKKKMHVFTDNIKKGKDGRA